MISFFGETRPSTITNYGYKIRSFAEDLEEKRLQQPLRRLLHPGAHDPEIEASGGNFGPFRPLRKKLAGLSVVSQVFHEGGFTRPGFPRYPEDSIFGLQLFL